MKIKIPHDPIGQDPKIFNEYDTPLYMIRKYEKKSPIKF